MGKNIKNIKIADQADWKKRWNVGMEKHLNACETSMLLILLSFVSKNKLSLSVWSGKSKINVHCIIHIFQH